MRRRRARTRPPAPSTWTRWGSTQHCRPVPPATVVESDCGTPRRRPFRRARTAEGGHGSLDPAGTGSRSRGRARERARAGRAPQCCTAAVARAGGRRRRARVLPHRGRSAADRPGRASAGCRSRGGPVARPHARNPAAAEHLPGAGLMADPGHRPGRIPPAPGQGGPADAGVDTCVGRRPGGARAGDHRPGRAPGPVPGRGEAGRPRDPRRQRPAARPDGRLRLAHSHRHQHLVRPAVPDLRLRAGVVPPVVREVPVADPSRGPGPDQRGAPERLRHR